MNVGRKIRRGNKAEPQIGEQNTERLLYQTMSGVLVPYGPVSIQDIVESQMNIESEFRERGEPIDEPEYTIKTVTGEEVSFPITKDNLTAQNKDGSTNPEKSAERQVLWDMHVDAQMRMSVEAKIAMEDIMLDGILIKMPDRNDERVAKWIKKQKKRHIRIPEDEDDFYKFWLSRYIFKSPFDFATCFTQILEVSAKGTAVEGKLKAAMSLFRSGIQSIADEQEDQVDSTSENKEELAAEQVEVQQSDAGSDDGESVEPSPF